MHEHGTQASHDRLLKAYQLLSDTLEQTERNVANMDQALGLMAHFHSTWEERLTPVKIQAMRYSRTEKNIGESLTKAHDLLAHANISRKFEIKILDGPGKDFHGYMVAVKELKNSVDFLSSNGAEDDLLRCPSSLLSKGLDVLYANFLMLLREQSKPIERETLLKSSEFELVSPIIVTKLQGIADILLGSSHHEQCLKAYRDARSAMLESSLRKLGLEELSKRDVRKLEWSLLRGKIVNWTKVMKIATERLFPAEKMVCHKVFESLDMYRDACFVEIAANSIIRLLRAGEVIVRTEVSSDKLFVILDMFELIHLLIPKINSTFSGEAAKPIRDSASSLERKMVQSARDIIIDFVRIANENDTHKPQALDGTIHPMTNYIMQYVGFIIDYQRILRLVYDEDENTDFSNSCLAGTIMEVIAALQRTIDAQAKHFQDQALGCIFLMNNIHYIVKSVKRWEKNYILGDDWIPKHRRAVQQYAQQYQRNSWGKVFQCIGSQGSTSSGPPSKTTLKERLKNFNSLFHEVFQKQSKWSIPDHELRDAVILSVAEVLLPAYRNFLEHHSNIIKKLKHPERYIKHTPEDVDRLLLLLFDNA